MRLSRLSSLTAIALTAGLLSQAHAVLVTGKKGSCSAVWETGPALVTVGNAKSGGFISRAAFPAAELC